MVAIPWLGHPSKKAAIIALHQEGKSNIEIAALCECSDTNVGVVLMEWRRRLGRDRKNAEYGWTFDKLIMLNRLWPKVLEALSDGLKVPLADVKAYLEDKVRPEIPEPTDPKPEEEPLPKPLPVVPTMVIGYRLRVPGEDRWLHESWERLTKDRRFAWKGSKPQADKMYDEVPLATGLELDPVIAPGAG